MKYEKPVVAVLAPAARVIQGHLKDSTPNPDSISTFVTAAAYEADE